MCHKLLVIRGEEWLGEWIWTAVLRGPEPVCQIPKPSSWRHLRDLGQQESPNVSQLSQPSRACSRFRERNMNLLKLSGIERPET
jgi:hypothetical protein